MSGSPSLRPRRIRKAPQKYGVWHYSPVQGGDEGRVRGSVHDSDHGSVHSRVRPCVIPDLVDSSDPDDSDDDQDFSSPRLGTHSSPNGPPPPRVSGPAFSPPPMNVSPIFPFNTSSSPPTVRESPASLNSSGGMVRDELESEENISTITVDDSLHLVLTPTQDFQGQPVPSSPSSLFQGCHIVLYVLYVL